ncbi:hypothetical protein K432DRAFT_422869 [Lepidopterella palustris CBS 459.81]|uniref:BIR-domain-containing protein n=1 Tax=Lepidopterella palustris CBS 459.81 TaxID=1314670 RepID=A0A8E2JIZ4_9PEZI|nr:hypothetical protein K432DRAFT_422869 [Lepidopterella palustris CBS 459.81]
MVLPDGVHTLAGRLETFQTAHHLPKRRASSSKKKTPSTISWPHETPAPEELALAGFYYKPSATNPDNVQCFICHSQLDGWEAGDNAAFEHLTHAPDCGWAINVCIRLRNGDPNRVEDDPMSGPMMEARAATFMDSWPHEGKKGWKCKMQKMVEAGWCYDPSPEYDDGVTCSYCNLSLDGWEPKDNPMEEHRRRAEDCYFFALCDSYAATRKPVPKKGRQSRASKVSRLSTQSNLTTFSEAPSLMSQGGAPTEVDDSILTTATNGTTASMAGKGRKGRPKATAKVGKKTTRSRKTATASESTMAEDPVDPMPVDMSYAEEASQAARKQSKRSTKKSDILQWQNQSVVGGSSPPRRATRTRNTRTKAKPRLSEDQSQLHSELFDAAMKASDPVSQQGTPKVRRGTKRTSDGMAKFDSSVVVLEDAAETYKAPAAKLKKGRKGTKRAEEPQPESYTGIEVPEELFTPKLKAAPKTRKGKQPTKKDEDVIAAEPNLDDFPAPPSSVRREATPLQSLPLSSIRGDITPHQSTPRPPSNEPSPAQPSPTPVRSAVRPGEPSPASATRPPTARISAAMQTTPSPSPQSSDVENKPPSSRPASIRPPLSNRQTNFIPLASTTPHVSPSKHGQSNTITGGLASSMAWQPIDLENVFLSSPSSAALQPQLFDSASNRIPDAALDKENIPQGLSVAEVVKRVREGLTSPEKKMTVEQWIYFNAKRGEEKLRSECERLVGTFETEGGRALLALEGIECVQ